MQYYGFETDEQQHNVTVGEPLCDAHDHLNVSLNGRDTNSDSPVFVDHQSISCIAPREDLLTG